VGAYGISYDDRRLCPGSRGTEHVLILALAYYLSLLSPTLLPFCPVLLSPHFLCSSLLPSLSHPSFLSERSSLLRYSAM
jgi:hypothetical protein